MQNMEKNNEDIDQFKQHEGDTGSSEVQVAILTKRINRLTDHLREHKHDYSTRRGLLTLVGKRKKLLEYIKKKNTANYSNLIEKLGLRK